MGWRGTSCASLFKCSSVGGPPYEPAVTSKRQRRDIQLDTGTCRGPAADTTRQLEQAIAHRKIMSPTATPGKNKTRARQRPYDHPHREGAHGAVTKPVHWSWDRPPDDNQPPRMPGCHFREANACSTLQLTGKSTASKLAEKPCAARLSVWSGDSAALRRGGHSTTRTATCTRLPNSPVDCK